MALYPRRYSFICMLFSCVRNKHIYMYLLMTKNFTRTSNQFVGRMKITQFKCNMACKWSNSLHKGMDGCLGQNVSHVNMVMIKRETVFFLHTMWKYKSLHPLVNNTWTAGTHQIYNQQDKRSKERMSNFCSSDNCTQIIHAKENKEEGKKLMNINICTIYTNN
jgi:hypothetical protein